MEVHTMKLVTARRAILAVNYALAATVACTVFAMMKLDGSTRRDFVLHAMRDVDRRLGETTVQVRAASVARREPLDSVYATHCGIADTPDPPEVVAAAPTVPSLTSFVDVLLVSSSGSSGAAVLRVKTATGSSVDFYHVGDAIGESASPALKRWDARLVAVGHHGVTCRWNGENVELELDVHRPPMALSLVDQPATPTRSW